MANYGVDAYAEALAQSVTMGFNPMHKLMLSSAAQQNKVADLEYDKEAKSHMDDLVRTIEELQARNADQKLVDSYQRMLDKYTK